MADTTKDTEAPAATALIGPGGQVTIPEAIRQAAGLELNHPVAIEIIPDGILLKPIQIDPDQAWYWTPEWQEGEREVDAQIAAGQGTVYMSTEEFFAALDARAEPHADV